MTLRYLEKMRLSLALVALVALVAPALVISPLGCGGEGTGTTSGDTTTTTTTTTTTSATTTTTSTTTSAGTGGMGGMGGAGGMGGTGGMGGAGGSGTGGIGGVGGSGGMGGSGGSGGMGGTGGVGGMAPTFDCHWNGPEICDPGFYCDAPGCGGGTCTKKPDEVALDKTQAPVCGCDGTTYWNTDVAAFHGVTTEAMSGACPGGGMMACDDANPCPIGFKCNRPIADQGQCLAAGPGTCWVVPVQCSFDGPKGRACTNLACETVCSLIQSQNAWFDDGTCP